MKELASKTKNALVVGSGFIGVEVAENLVEMGINTSLVEMAPQVLPGYDYDVSLFIKIIWRKRG